MIRAMHTYSIRILKKDIQYWDDDEFVFIVMTDDLETAEKIMKKTEHSERSTESKS